MCAATRSESGLILEARDVVRSFGGLRAVDGLSFRIDAGELVGLIGPNGSGKTTLANLICGALPLTSGDIIFRGKSIRGLKDHQVARLGIARTFQVTRPFTRLTVQANVAVGAMFSGPYLGRDEAFARADETLARVGLAGKARHSGAQLTVADRKRLELARALVQNPTLLILDEAMAGLNLHEIDVVIDLVREINRQGVTIIVVEHVMKVIMVLCQRVIVLHHGRKLAEGSPAEIAADDGVIREYLGARYLRSQ